MLDFWEKMHEKAIQFKKNGRNDNFTSSKLQKISNVGQHWEETKKGTQSLNFIIFLIFQSSEEGGGSQTSWTLTPQIRHCKIQIIS